MYSRKKVTLQKNRNRKQNNANDQNGRTDANLTEKITKFRPIINADTVYSLFFDVGLGNCPVKFETKITFTLKTTMNKLFETNAK